MAQFKSFPKNMSEWQAIQDTYNMGEEPQIFRPEDQMEEPSQPQPTAPMDYMQQAQNEADEQAGLSELEMPSKIANFQGVPEDTTQAMESAISGQTPLSRSEKLLEEYNKLMAKDREELQAARSRDRMLKVGGALGDALATYLNAQSQMKVKAPGVQVQQGAGLGKVAEMFATAPEIESDIKSRREDLLAQYKAAMDGTGLTPYQLEMLKLRAEDQRLREQQLAGVSERFGKNLEFKKEEKNELSDKQLESISSFDKVDALSEELKARAQEFKDKLGPYAPTVEQAKNYVPGMQEDPDWAAFKASTTDNLSQYIKSLSGLTVSDKERASLLQSVPKVQDKYDVYMSKMNELQKRLRSYKTTELETAKKYQGKNIKGYETPVSNLSQKDEQALRWANANPKDKRAAAIKKRLGR